MEKHGSHPEQLVYYQLHEVCRIAGIEQQFVIDLIGYGILEPEGDSPTQWAFDWHQLQRCKRARRLRQDLGINIPGIGLSLELIDELQQLREELRRHGFD